jgi:peptidoglycan/LPS O-acetylase OafA/YrhL
MVASALFARNYYTMPDDAGWYTGHLWSLAVEEHFYLLWPGLLVLWTPRKSAGRVALFALGIAVWRIVEFRLRLLEHVIPGLGFYFRTDIRLDGLLWGCFVALLLREVVWRDRLTTLLRGARWWIAVALLVAVMVAQRCGCSGSRC